MSEKSDLIRRLLRSRTAWRLSGLTYHTAVSATSGKFRSIEDYLSFCGAQMTELARRVSPLESALEFGSGLGGNLFALRDRIACGVGLEVNRLYIAQARRIAKRIRCLNVSFQSYDGVTFPRFSDRFDLVFSIGVFERLSKAVVKEYVSELSELTTPQGCLALYFLSPRARLTTFVERLGDDAYEYWGQGEAIALLEALGIRVEQVLNWGLVPNQDRNGVTAVADMYICSKAGPPREDRGGLPGSRVAGPTSSHN